MMRFDNPRTTIQEELQPGHERQCQLSVRVPDASDLYRLEIDIEWEEVLWFKEQDVVPVNVDLVVE
jgi:hypothetical protein